jgi:four helix bundle protein
MVQQYRQDIRKRAFKYSLRAIKLYHALQGAKDGAGWVIGKQFLRAATSIGANGEEAQAGETRADFVHKYGIAQKEARETIYWLGLLAEGAIVPKRRLTPLIKETEEIYAVITAIIRNAKNGSAGGLKGKK